MKRVLATILMITLLFTVTNADAQIRKIPAEVTDAFKGKYPSASAVEWKDKLTVFQANFQMDGEKYETRFNNAGEWQETEKNMEQDKLPGAVKDGFSKSKFTDWELKQVSHVQKKDGSDQYRILVKKTDIEKNTCTLTKPANLSGIRLLCNKRDRWKACPVLLYSICH